MKRLKPLVSAVADNDIGVIVEYIAQDNPSAALEFREEFIATLNRLCQLPDTGHRQRYTDSEEFSDIAVIRVSSRFRNYLVFYRWDSNHVVVLRVLHGARDIPTLLLEDFGDGDE